MNSTGKYDDIINLPHHVSKRRAKMSMADRAAQFGSFAPLTGHKDALDETARVTDDRIEQDEYQQSSINKKICLLQSEAAKKQAVSITFFVPDKSKSGGEYITVTGTVKKIDEYKRCVVMDNGIKISINDIIDIDGDFFDFW
ncbi:MAG: hypothetical protein IKV41_05575 [Oscillospiraceae bacterium]|nr:hypothetical protein [Oscillospiraceae bacterium]